MALNKEDKSDVKNAMGKALANKVSSATKDSPLKERIIKDSSGKPVFRRVKEKDGWKTHPYEK